MVGHTNAILSLAFHPNESILVSCSIDESVKLWDMKNGRCLQTLRIEPPYANMKIGGATGMGEAQKMSLRALGAIEG